jgi:hypothetical protein
MRDHASRPHPRQGTPPARPESTRGVSITPVPPSGARDPLLARAAERHGEQLARAVVRPRCHLYLRVSSPDQDLDVGPDGRRVRGLLPMIATRLPPITPVLPQS